MTSTITYYNPHETAILSPNQKMAIGSIQSGYIRLVLGVVEPDTNKPSITMAGSNFAPFERGCGADGWTSSIPGAHCSQKLCRFGPEALPRSEIMIPDNNTDPLNLLENVVPASFINGQRIRCQTPSRPPGTTLQVHVSMSGLHNFSSTTAEVREQEQQPHHLSLSLFITPSPTYTLPSSLPVDVL